jgi:glycosyltransferase involved in cell wall biosynthesis
MDFWYLCPNFILLRRDGSLCDGPPDGGLGCVPCERPELAAVVAESGGREAALARALAGAPAGDASPAARLSALVRRKDFMLRHLRLAGSVIAPSRFLAAMFARNGFPAERIEVVPYGLEAGAVVRADVVRPRSPLRVGFAGVLSPWKAPHLAVEAVRKVAGAIRLTVHGRTDEYLFRDYIARVLRAAEGDARISFPGAFGRERLGAVLADLDVLVVPSTWYENTPFVILEAFAAGVPVIASDLGGMAEIVRDGVNGFLFTAGDAESLASVLRECVARPERLRGLRTGAVPSIADNYERFLACYRSRPARP